jgi:tetratricopeptide (TPR) repeat protein
MKSSLTLFVTLMFFYGGLSAQVVVTQTKITIPTYLPGPAETVPLFYTPELYQNAQRRVYPYVNISRLSNTKKDKEYNALILENELIKICVLPELGGRLYYALDKTNGYDFIYRNNVIKPSLIGMAGAWISGGVEWNIPHHHRASTFMPVDHKVVENTDGSKTIWVGEYEKRSQTRWCVGLTLYPGKSYIEVSLRNFNVTPVSNSFLMWANTAVSANKDYQVIFPPDVERATFHQKIDFTDYPVSHQVYQGIDFRNVDISWWKNTFSPTSFFAWDTQKDFMAGIDHAKKAGTAIIGDHHIFSGKKFWNWGNNEVQRLWDQMLTDTDGPYLELMMGLYSDNQPDYSWSSPYDMKDGTMYYYPVKNLTSVKEANKNAALNLELQNGNVKIQINSTSRMSGCKLTLLNNGNELLSDKINLDPATVFTREIKVSPTVKEEDLTIRLLSSENADVISYNAPAKKNDPEPERYKPPVNPSEIDTPDKLYQTGIRLEQFGNAVFDPLKYYSEVLRRDPNHILVNVQLGEYYLKQLRYKDASAYLKKAVDAVTKDYTSAKYGDPLYYLGLTLFYEEKYKEAYEILFKASWNAEWSSQSYYLLAIMDCQRGDYEPAIGKLNISLRHNANNIEALNLLAIILRKYGKTELALKTRDEVQKIDPISLTAAFEFFQSRKNKDNMEDTGNLRNFFRDEVDNYLETASRYIMTGFYKDAVELLQIASHDELPNTSHSPLIYYYLGYCSMRSGNTADASKWCKRASEQNLDYCFPYGHWSKCILKEAIKINPDDATAHYLLGNLECNNDQDTAFNELQKAVSLAKIPMAYRNLAFLQANYFDKPGDAMISMAKAIEITPDNSNFLLEYDSYAEYKGVHPEERLAFLEKNMAVTTAWDKTNLKRVELLNFAGQYEKAIEILNNQHFFIAERTALNPHISWTNALLGRGIQYLNNNEPDKAIRDFNEIFRFPRNLEISRDSKISLANYWLGRAYKLKGDRKKASEYFSIMANNNEKFLSWGAEPNALIPFLKAMALKELGKKTEADEIFNKLIVTGNDLLDMKYHEALQDKSVKVHQTQKISAADGYFNIALGNAGLGNVVKADEFYTKALETLPALFDIRIARAAVNKK